MKIVFPPMNFLSSDLRVLSRSVLGLTALVMTACSSGPHISDPKVFDLSTSARRAHFPRVQNIGVLELSGSRITSRPFQGSLDQVEYVATGGAMIEKRLTPPIFAQGEEILVTPDAAIISGQQAMVKKGSQLLKAESSSSRFIIDGTQVKTEGPHSIQDLVNGKTTFIGTPPRPASIAAQPEFPQSPASKPAVSEAPKKPQPAAPNVATETAKPKPQAQPKPTPTPAAKPKVVQAPAKPVTSPATAPKTQPSPKPAPAADRQKLLNLMREPSE